MSRRKNLQVDGESPSREERVLLEKHRAQIEEAGFVVNSVLSGEEGSPRFVASLKPGTAMAKARKVLEADGWQVGAPHYSNGKMMGFKLTKTGKATSGRAWG